MNVSRFLAIVVISVLMCIVGQHVYGQYGGAPSTNTANDYKVSINSDKTSYAIGETITLSGNVSKYEENRTLQITIFDSANKLVLTKEIPVDTNGIFSYDLLNNEKLSKVGEYTLRAQYGTTHMKVETISFTLVSDTKKIDEPIISEKSSKIPDWIKKTMQWYLDGSISEDEMISAIQFLVKEGIIKLN